MARARLTKQDLLKTAAELGDKPVLVWFGPGYYGAKVRLGVTLPLWEKVASAEASSELVEQRTLALGCKKPKLLFAPDSAQFSIIYPNPPITEQERIEQCLPPVSPQQPAN